MGELEIRELGPDNLESFLEFFDKEAFPDNPYWAGCYCNYYHAPDEDKWQERPAETNRNEKSAAIRAGRASGMLAFIDGKPIGWVNAGLRSNYQNARAFHEAMVGGEDSGYVMCFIVSPNHRGEGIASTLLDRACEMLRAKGATYVEGYPSNREASGPIPWTAQSYHGTRAMYERAGFQPVREYEGFTQMRKTFD